MNSLETPRFVGIWHSVLAAAILGLVSAVADWIWFRFLEDGAILPALVHGLIFFVVIALVLAPSGTSRGEPSLAGKHNTIKH